MNFANPMQNNNLSQKRTISSPYSCHLRNIKKQSFSKQPNNSKIHFRVDVCGKANRMSISPQFEGNSRDVFYQHLPLLVLLQESFLQADAYFPRHADCLTLLFFILLLTFDLGTNTFFSVSSLRN